jgi:hypothetical protein
MAMDIDTGRQFLAHAKTSSFEGVLAFYRPLTNR